jgi:hypothetical protein
MKHVPALVLLLLVFGASALPAKKKTDVHISYDREVDLSKYDTFTWGATPTASLSDSVPAVHSLIKNLIELEIVKAGMYEDKDKPQTRVTYWSEESSEVRVDVNNAGYTYGTGWHYDPFWDAAYGAWQVRAHGRSVVYPRGTLVIDIWDVETKKVVWRATVSTIVPENPSGAVKRIEKAIRAMAAEWEKMKREGLVQP